MSLSNTATPYYYGLFKEKVLRGEIKVCQEISMEMNRIDALIDNPGVYYDRAPVEGWIKFCEKELTLTDGSDFFMLDTFKLWGEELYGWYYFEERSVYIPYDAEKNHGGHYVRKMVKKRLINKQFLIVGRGAAKTLYDTCIQAYELNVNTETTEQITTAPTMMQADEVLKPLRTAILKARGPFFKMLTEGSLQNTTGNVRYRKKLASTKKGIENFMTNSILEIKPMSIDKLQGLRTKVATIDEWLSVDIRESPIGAIEQGSAKVDDWIILATSSEGTIRNSVGDSIKMELLKILKNEYKDIHSSIFWYKLDDIKEISDPSMWIKANPNLGFTVSYETYQREVERAENAPSERNDIIAKRFGIPTEGYTYFFTYEETKPHKKREFWQMPCSMGCDLSRGDDFCSFVFLFPLKDGTFGIKTRNYITHVNLLKLNSAMRAKYEDFIKEGTLIVMDGKYLDMMMVYEDLQNFIDHIGYEVLCLGYDPYAAKEFIDRWIQEHSDYGVTKVIQGARTESVPLGELKNLAEERALLFDEDMMQFGMGNAITLEDTNGNRKLLKLRYDKKIDPVASMMDAWVAYKLFKDDFL